jgi:hypothetical protein
MKEIRKSFDEIFSDHSRVRLSRRVDKTVLTGVLKRIDEAQQTDPGRTTATVSRLSDELKVKSMRIRKPKAATDSTDGADNRAKVISERHSRAAGGEP